MDDDRPIPPAGPPGMPLWAKVFTIIAVVLVALFLIALLSGGNHGPGSHGPGRHL